MTRVVVTGVGCISALGRGKAPTWAAALSGQSRIIRVQVPGTDPTLFTEAPIAAVAETDCAAPENLADGRIFKLLDRFSKLAVISTDEALTESGAIAAYAPDDIAVIFGSSTGGLTSLEDAYYRVYGQRGSRVHPMTVPRFMGSASASAISLAFGITGPAWCLSSACASAPTLSPRLFTISRPGAPKWSSPVAPRPASRMAI